MIYFDNSFIETNVYVAENLFTGDTIKGPAVVIDKNRFATPDTAVIALK